MADIDPLNLDFAVRYPDAFARVLARSEVEEAGNIIESLPAAGRAAIVARLPLPLIDRLLAADRHTPGDWLADAPFDDAVLLLSRLPRERRLALVNGIEDRERKRRLLRQQEYPAHSAGALVGEIPLRINAESPAKEIVEELRKLDEDSRAPAVVVDNEGVYLGVLDRWQLLSRRPPAGKVSNYVVAVRAVMPETPVSSVVLDEQWHTRNWLPVTDHRNRVLGAVSRQDIFKAAGQHSGHRPGGSDVLVELLADLVHACDALLVRALSRGKPV